MIAETALMSYLTGVLDDQEWALLDNLDADEARDVAKRAITMLRQANVIVALSAVALDDMTPRQVRFAARDAAVGVIEPYIKDLSERLGRGDAD